MNIQKFDIESGIYLTQIDNINSSDHSHPAIEIIATEHGDFTLTINNTVYQGLKFAVIGSNIIHKLSLSNVKATILIIEHRDKCLKDILREHGFIMNNGYCLSMEDNKKIVMDNIISTLSRNLFKSEYDSRVQQVIDYIQNYSVNYFDLKRVLHEIIPLSESRLSHLFKKNVGISIKKYLVWNNLKLSIQDYLHKNESLLDALLSNGFYDQPHFNRTYKSLIGTSPAKTYNSRILQE